MNTTPRGPQDLTNSELIEEFQSAVWADAMEDKEELGRRTVATKEEILRRMRSNRDG